MQYCNRFNFLGIILLIRLCLCVSQFWEHRDVNEVPDAARESASGDSKYADLGIIPSVNDYNTDGYTPLMIAARIGDEKVVASYIKHGANVHLLYERTGNTALLLATERNHYFAVYELIKGGSNLDATSKMGFTSLLVAITQNAYQIVDLLLQHGSNPNTVRRNTKYSALMMACQVESVKSVESLLKYKADVDTSNETGDTPLLYASITGNTEIVSKIIASNASLDHANQRGSTALMLAASRGHLSVIKALIEAGAATDIVAIGGLNVLDFAIEKKHADVINYLYSVGCDIGKYRYNYRMDAKALRDEVMRKRLELQADAEKKKMGRYNTKYNSDDL